VWLALAGRGWGKTRVGAEWVRSRERRGARRIHLVGRSAADARDVMVEGESGLLACYPPDERPRYEPSKRRITFRRRRTRGGSLAPECIALVFSAEEPDQLRGPQCDTAWADELAMWPIEEAWSNLRLGLRSAASGLQPRAMVSTTPKPTRLIRALLADDGTHVTRGTTYENVANMAPAFIAEMRRLYEGTRLGRQELYADVLDDAPGALWRRATMIDPFRVRHIPSDLVTVVIGVDPAATTGERANETGIIVFGVDSRGHGYVLHDASGRYSPGEWGTIVRSLYTTWQANYVVAEVNQGGDMVEATLRATREDAGEQERITARTIMLRTVHAARGKRTRAEPVAALYEQGKVHHYNSLPVLEDQLCTWEPDLVIDDGPQKKIRRHDSPDRLDALVWAVTITMLTPRARRHEVLDYDDGDYQIG
jgi:phage terminase large subunit-like protein